MPQQWPGGRGRGRNVDHAERLVDPNEQPPVNVAEEPFIRIINGVKSFNPYNVPQVERMVVISADDEVASTKDYHDFCKGIVNICSRNDRNEVAKVLGRPVCHVDTEIPFMVYELVFEGYGFKVPNTKVLVEKGTLYGWAFTVRGVWYHCTDVPYHLHGSISAGFRASYKLMDGKVETVGPGAIVQSVSALNKGKKSLDYQEPFKRLLHNVNEPCRLLFLRAYIGKMFHSGNFVKTELFLPEYQSQVNQWSSICKALRRFEIAVDLLKNDMERSGTAIPRGVENRVSWTLDVHVARETRVDNHLRGLMCIGILKPLKAGETLETTDTVEAGDS